MTLSSCEITPPPFQREQMSTLFSCALALPIHNYTTTFTNFPGTNCISNWGMRGDFFTTLNLYQNGLRVAEVAVRHCNETGCLHADLGELAPFIDENKAGILLLQTCHTKDIPLDMYMFHTHHRTGSYVSYPVATYMGDQIYTVGHSLHLENTLFWPGIISNEHSESLIAVLNPYHVNMSYQFSIYLPDGTRRQSEVLKTSPFSHTLYSLEDVFPELKENASQNGTISFCIAGQYKLVSYFMIRNRATGIYSTIDHLHQYCLF
jgi:hypothetical protein